MEEREQWQGTRWSLEQTRALGTEWQVALVLGSIDRSIDWIGRGTPGKAKKLQVIQGAGESAEDIWLRTGLR